MFITIDWVPLAFVFAGVVFSFASGLVVPFGDKKLSGALMIAAIICFFYSGKAIFDQGKAAEKALNLVHTYIIKERGQSSFGMPLSIYDMNSGESRVVVVKEYPPNGFVEAITADGKTMLLPKPKEK